MKNVLIMELNKEIKKLRDLLSTELNKLPVDKRQKVEVFIKKMDQSKTPQELEVLKSEVLETAKSWL